MSVTSTVIRPLASSVFCCFYYMVGGGGLFLLEQLEVKEDGVWKPLGDRCIQVGGSGRNRKCSSRYGKSAADRVTVETITRGRKATVSIRTGNGEKVIEFGRVFLTSFETEVTHFVSEAGTEYRLTHWGERDCEVPQSQQAPATVTEVRAAPAAVA
jgi:hypothetical protein